MGSHKTSQLSNENHPKFGSSKGDAEPSSSGKYGLLLNKGGSRSFFSSRLLSQTRHTTIAMQLPAGVWGGQRTSRLPRSKNANHSLPSICPSPRWKMQNKHSDGVPSQPTGVVKEKQLRTSATGSSHHLPAPPPPICQKSETRKVLPRRALHCWWFCQSLRQIQQNSWPQPPGFRQVMCMQPPFFS